MVNSPNNIATVDAEREAASGAVSSMTSVLGLPQDVVTVDESGKLVVSLLETLKAFSSDVDKIATV